MTFEGPVELIKRLMKDDKVSNISIMKHQSRMEVSYVADYDMAERRVQADLKGDEPSGVPVPLPWNATDEQLGSLRSRYGDARALLLLSVIGNDALLLIDEPEPEGHQRLTRWFGKALDRADRELLAQDGAKAVSWKTKSPRELFQKMAQHYQELDIAIAQNKNWFGQIEAIDIVNYALMIATRCSMIMDGSEEWV